MTDRRPAKAADADPQARKAAAPDVQTSEVPAAEPPVRPEGGDPRAAAEADRLTALRAGQAAWWLRDHPREAQAWARGEIPDEAVPVPLPEGVTAQQAEPDLQAASERAMNQHRMIPLEGRAVHEGWMPLPETEP